MAAQQITIGPEFFSKAKNDYDNWHWALMREFLQNSIDAKASLIEIVISEVGGDTRVVVHNDGNPMDESILVGKLLSLGGSGKSFGSGSVGGFGKAKEILYFCHQSYLIESGSFRVDGCGAQYDITGDNPFLDGTRSTIVIGGNHVEELKKAVRTFARFAQWSGALLMNEESFDCDQSKGARRRDLGFGVVFTNKSDSHKCVVRIGGIPMFYQYCGHDRLVIVELAGRSDEVLTSNRDGLVSPYRGELSSFITELSVDKKSALRPSVPKYERFAGRKLGHTHSRKEVVDARSFIDLQDCVGSVAETREVFEAVDSDLDVAVTEFDDGVDCSPNPVGSVSLGTRTGEHVRSAAFTSSEEVRRVVSLGSEFIIKNETNLVVPDYYRPDSEEFSEYSRKLIRIWGRLMVELHRLFDHEAEFGVGFIFEEGRTGAEHEKGHYGRVYYIAPAQVVEQSSTYSKSFKKRWKFDNAGKKMLLSIAAHEFVHGLGYDWHCENFAQKYTEVVGHVLADVKRFNWCFK